MSAAHPVAAVCMECGAKAKGDNADAVNTAAAHQLIPNQGCPGRSRQRSRSHPLDRPAKEIPPELRTAEAVDYRRRYGVWPDWR